MVRKRLRKSEATTKGDVRKARKKTRSARKTQPPTLDPHIIEMTVYPEDI